MSEPKSLDKILEGFDPEAACEKKGLKKPITVWLPIDYTERFKKLQAQTNTRFGKTCQAILQAAIDHYDVEPDAVA